MSTSGPSGRTVATSIASSATMESGAWKCRSYREREFLYGRRWATHALALEEADEQKAWYLREGGVLIA
jgi:hypothetical protein